MLVSGPVDSTVLRPFLEEVPPSVIPSVQILAELLLAGSCHSTCQFKQFPCCRQFRIVGEVSAYYHHLVELAHLDGIAGQDVKKSTHAVTDDAIDDKSILPEPSNSLHIVGNRLMTDKLVPEYLVAESILDDQQAKITTPIGSIHVHYYILVFGNDTYMAHRLEPPPYRTLVHPVLLCQLRYGLLPINILRLYTLIIKPFDGNKLTTAVLAFIALATMLETIFYRKETATIKAFFA